MACCGVPRPGTETTGRSGKGDGLDPDASKGLTSIREARAALRALGLDDEVGQHAALIVTELGTNAMLHAGGIRAIRILPTPDGGVRREVEDGSDVAPSPGPAGAMSGRGLVIVDALASRWGSQRARNGKVVWAELAPG
jgi:anti-sigma regulatory factor (Ser/Thr protein kinase)